MRIVFAFALYPTEQNQRENIYHHTTRVSPPPIWGLPLKFSSVPGCLWYRHSFCQLDWWNIWSQDKDDGWTLVNWATVLWETKAGPAKMQLKAPDGNFRNAELWLIAAPSEISRKTTDNSSTDLSIDYFGTSHSQCREGWGGDRGENDTNGAYPLHVHATNISQTYLPLIKSLVYLFRSLKGS